MTKAILTFAFLSAMFITSANAQKAKKSSTAKVPYTQVKNYFVKNTFQQGDLKSPKIETQEEFDKIFGAAKVMGEDGKPTVVDFSKQYVIAFIPEETNQNFTIAINGIVKKRKKIIFSYTYSLGDKTSSTWQPYLAAVVDKKYNGKVVLVKK